MTTSLKTTDLEPTTLFEDNVACLAQLRKGYIKGDRMKHISSEFFYTHELQKNGDINVKQVKSSDSLIDLFTKSLSASTFCKLVKHNGMKWLKDLKA